MVISIEVVMYKNDGDIFMAVDTLQLTLILQ